MRAMRQSRDRHVTGLSLRVREIRAKKKTAVSSSSDNQNKTKGKFIKERGTKKKENRKKTQKKKTRTTGRWGPVRYGSDRLGPVIMTCSRILAFTSRHKTTPPQTHLG